MPQGQRTVGEGDAERLSTCALGEEVLDSLTGDETSLPLARHAGTIHQVPNQLPQPSLLRRGRFLSSGCLVILHAVARCRLILAKYPVYTVTVTEVSVLVTGRYSVSRSMGSRPASRIRRTRSCRRIPCGVVAPAS
jgi:hypothetical protein